MSDDLFEAEDLIDRLPGMSEQRMVSIVRQEIDNALGWTGTRLTKARERNLEEWFGNRRGDELSGRSQATSRIVFEQVEQLLPGLIEVFVASRDVCKFLPRSPDDDESAKQATVGCNYVFEQNNGVEVLITMFRDALIQRNGIVKVYWDESKEGYYEDYEAKFIPEIAQLMQDKFFELKEATPVIQDPTSGDYIEIPEEMLEGAQIDPMMLRFNVRGVRRPDDGRVKLENVPPEEFLINRDARGLHHETTRFVAQRIRTTESDLISSGIDPDLAKMVPSSQPSSTVETAARIRSSQQDGNEYGFTDRTDSERMVMVTECYTLLDSDGDGVSEWWQILVGGEYGQQLLSAEPCEGHPFASVTPIPIPHRFYGLALADVVSDLNEINTTLWRQYLDSLYLMTDPRAVVLSQGQGESATPMVNLDQLVDAQPGGYVEEYVANALRFENPPNSAADIIPALQMHTEMLQSRTGITPEGQGIDPQAINKTAYGVMVQQSASAQRATLIARTFADTGVKDIFRLIYRELLQHGDAMQVFSGGEWVDINPSDWATNLDASIAVGLGHGTRMEKVANLNGIAELQKELIGAGLTNMVTMDNLYNTASALIEAFGFKDAERFITDPSTSPPPEPKEDPAEKAVEAQQQIEVMRLELDRQKLETERFKAMVDAKMKELDHELEVEKLRRESGGEEPIPYDAPWSIIPGGM